ncbi:MAG: alpha/beta fold hydrolase [Gemmatimonadetes bacterium]|nr:alpha/beta fold hydrolase [Gemmatimonadota bacterium]
MQAVVNGIRMHWQEAGRGEPVLLVHGFPFDSSLWEPQLERLPRRWRWLAPDLRGFGRTEGGVGGGPYGMELFAEDLAALLEELGVTRAVVCGVSMGGYIAMAMVRSYPERVRALVLCDTKAGAETEQGKKGRAELAERVLAEGSSALVAGLLPRLLAERTRREQPELVQWLSGVMESVSPQTAARGLAGMAARADSTELLSRIAVPTLVLVGAEDVISGVAEAEGMAGGIPDGRIMVIPAAGHLPNLEQPPAFNRALVQFLEAID